MSGERRSDYILKAFYIDGTKIEANANRYTFVWCESTSNGYDLKYELPEARMFVIKSMDKVREVIQKNRSKRPMHYKKCFEIMGKNRNELQTADIAMRGTFFI